MGTDLCRPVDCRNAVLRQSKAKEIIRTKLSRYTRESFFFTKK